MRAIFGSHAVHLSSTPWSDVALCGESGDPDEEEVWPVVTCTVCLSLQSQKMGQTTHVGATTESA